PEKRKRYDQGGGVFGGFDPRNMGGQGGGGFSGVGGIGDILSDLFGGAGGGAGPGRRPNRPERGRDLETEVHVSFEQAVEGAQVPVSVATHSACPTCRGTGAKPGTTPTVCPKCNGRGIESQGQGLFSISQPCSECNGTGTKITDPCTTCTGQGFTRQMRRYRANIPAGVRDGSRVRLAGKGEPGRRGGPPGDLFVITRVARSPLFKRRGDNLEVEVPITIPEAIRGATVDVPTLSGTKRIRVPAGTQHGSVQRLRGEGPPRLGGRGRGELVALLNVETPTDLDAEQVELLQQFAKLRDERAGSKGFFDRIKEAFQ
nr:J domain-containing protein [Actinomycetota bacterium]